MSYVTYAELSKALEGKLLYNSTSASSAQPEQLRFEVELAELATRMHAKHPHYGFSPRYFTVASPIADAEVCVRELSVTLGARKLGGVKYWGGHFTLTGDRIRAARPRTHEIRTKDIKRAAAAFTKYFKPETDLEAFRKQLRVAKDLLWSAENQARENALTFTAFVRNFLVGHIIDNFETYADIATRAGATPTLVRAAKDAYDTSQVIYSAVGQDGFTVGVKADKYLVSTRSGATVTVYDASDLPKNINDKLGKLKLVTHGTHIRDTGLRINQNTFFVTEQKSDE